MQYKPVLLSAPSKLTVSLIVDFQHAADRTTFSVKTLIVDEE